MKITITLIMTIFWTFLTFGQNVLLSEDFHGNDADIAARGWTKDGHEKNWKLIERTLAKGHNPPEMALVYSPIFNGSTRLISKSFSTEGMSKVFMSFKQLVRNFGNNTSITVGVATRSNNGSWNSVWSQSVTSKIVETRNIVISNADVGARDFQVCFYFQGNSDHLDIWTIDDLEIWTSKHVTDVKMTGIENKLYYKGPKDVNIDVSLLNVGSNPINSLTLNYKLNNGTVVSEVLNNLNLSTSQKHAYTFSKPCSISSAGDYDLEVWASDVNGKGEDDDVTNNRLKGILSIAKKTETKAPLFEEFTSSTCPPCAEFNLKFFNDFMKQHPDVVVIKYQMGFPGGGDKYVNSDGRIRQTEYNVNGIPNLMANGVKADLNNIDGTYQSQKIIETVFNISAKHSVEGNTIKVKVDIMPYVSAKLKLHVAIIENETTKNVGSNGETSFKHVMMKMLPNGFGSLVDFKSETGYSQTFTYDMSSTKVEEMDDLRAVIFIQDQLDRTVLQSAYSTEETVGVEDIVFKGINIYPNPSSGLLKVKTDKPLAITITNLVGQQVFENREVNGDVTLDLTHLNNGVYILNVTDGKLSGSRKIILSK